MTPLAIMSLDDGHGAQATPPGSHRLDEPVVELRSEADVDKQLNLTASQARIRPDAPASAPRSADSAASARHDAARTQATRNPVSSASLAPRPELDEPEEDELGVDVLLAMEPPREDRSVVALGDGRAVVPPMRLPHVGGAPQQQQAHARGQQRNAGARGSGGGPKRRRKRGKRANITVECGDAAVVVHDLPLGDCQQTARWLAVVAQQRASLYPHMQRLLAGFRPGAPTRKVQGFYAPAALQKLVRACRVSHVLCCAVVRCV